MVQVKIEFCQCGHAPHAVELAEGLIDSYSRSLANNLLVTLEARSYGPCRYQVSVNEVLQRPTLRMAKEEIDAKLKLELKPKTGVICT